MSQNLNNLQFLSRGFIKQVRDNRVIISYQNIVEDIPRSCILGNTWFAGWHGDVVQNAQECIYFIPDK